MLNIPEFGDPDMEDDHVAMDKQKRLMVWDANYELADGFEMKYDADRELAIEQLAREEMEREMQRETEEWEALDKERMAKEMAKIQREKEQGRRKTKGKGAGGAGGGEKPQPKTQPPSKVKLKYKKKQAFSNYCGEYQPFIRENGMKRHNVIPDVVHPSNHFPLVARFRFSPSLLSGMWHGGQEVEEED